MSNEPHTLYQKELNEFQLTYSRAGVLLAAVLVLMGVGLDLSFYPQHVVIFGVARVITSVTMLGIFWLLILPVKSRWVEPLTLAWLSLPQFMISWMIWYTEGVGSIYFVGLHLAFYATGIVIPVSVIESVIFGLLTYALYFSACIFHPLGLSDSSQFLGVSIFIIFSATISASCTYFNERGRFNIFRLQAQVSEKNIALLQTNASLAKVKGHLIQQEKMAALGTLSAGLLHEVNNPVNYSLMAVNMALTEPAAKTDAQLRDCLQDAREGMMRVQSIVTDLKTFAYQKPGDESSRIFLLEKSIESALRLTGFELKNVQVTRDLPLDTHVLGNEPAIIGVLINLFSNAALALTKAAKGSSRIDIRATAREGRLWLTVRDSGTGISPDNLSRVFEPFFTTRDVGQGLGLGLSVSYGIIQRHGSVLQVASVAGEWTEFSFDLAQASPQA
jgi:two-component system, sensor histidine kinase PhcS